MPDKLNSLRTTWGICLLLALVTLFAYWGVFSSGFVEYDDPFYVVQNHHVQAGLSWKGIGWAFTTRATGNWHPLTWLSLMLDCDIFGFNATGFHTTNLVLHILNTLLLFLVLQRMTGARWRSAFVAALFALHPLHVESVAWVAERKDVLSTFFGMLTLWAYVRYAEKPGIARYWPVPALFAVGLLAKPMLVTLPFLLLLLDFWPLRRMPDVLKVFGHELRVGPRASARFPQTSWSRLLGEKAPLIALSATSCALTVWAQKASILSIIPLKYRLLNAALSYLRYMVKMVWPAKLYVIYPYPVGWPIWYPIVAVLVVGCISLVAVRDFKERPYLFTGWFWFLGTLVPVIGLVQVGLQAMADRYTYVPLIGLFIAAAWGGCELAEKWRLPPVLLRMVSVLVVAAFIPLTVLQVGYWKTSITLFQHALRMNPGNFVAENNLATSYAAKKELEPALEHLLRAKRLRPNFGQTYNSIGEIQFTLGRYGDAVQSFKGALEHHAPAGPAHYGLALAYRKQDKLGEALEQARAALATEPGNLSYLEEYGRILQQQGRYEEALGLYLEGAKVQPGIAWYHFHAAVVLGRLGRTTEAVAQYQQALAANPNLALALNNLAWILATDPNPTIGNGPEAVRLAGHACKLTDHRAPLMVTTLAAAYARDGRFEEAVAAADESAKLAATLGRTELAGQSRKLAALFRSRKACSETNYSSLMTPAEEPGHNGPTFEFDRPMQP